MKPLTSLLTQSRFYFFPLKKVSFFQRTHSSTLKSMPSTPLKTAIKKDFLCVEITLEKMMSLFMSHQICAEDIHCLDNASKQSLVNICLKTCLFQPHNQGEK
ncbi:MAG: hypothetical protein KAG26_02705 [Methylococcales bacterium]|nr:hypothetical protein [Methylococcales bacterium]